MNDMQNVFIIGSKGIPAKYGGFESFVEKLTQKKKSTNIKYHVSCAYDSEKNKDTELEFTYNEAHCFSLRWRKIGAAKAVVYDLEALNYCLNYIKDNEIKNPIIYILACRIGPFMWLFERRLKKYNCTVFVNPDGHEWKRAKWNYWIRKYWKYSERLMVKHAELLICDSKEIEKYICLDYKQYKPKTTFISYGAEVRTSLLTEESEKFKSWCNEKELLPNEYYLVVGRFVPENNYEAMIKEFMKSDSKKDFALITGVENQDFYDNLNKKTGFLNDKRIKFVGTVYDAELLMRIRESAFAYFHGHEVGGTNPSLLEALGATKLNLLLDVGFNKEVAEDAALYWNKQEGNLATLIAAAEKMDKDTILQYGMKAKDRIRQNYSWDSIVDQYENVFLGL